MRHLYILLFFLIAKLNCFSQEKNATINVDSVPYYLEVSNFHKSSFDYDKALIYARKAKQYAIKNKLQRELADSHLSIGCIYNELDRQDEAIENYIRSITIYNDLEASSNSAFCYYSLGISYLRKNNLNLADNYFNKALAEYKTVNVPEATDLIELQKGIIEKHKGNTKEAIKKFNAITAKASLETVPDAKVEAYFELAEIDTKTNPQSAISNLEKAYEISKEGHNTNQKLRILKRLSALYESTDNIIKAHNYLKKFNILRDSIFNIRTKTTDVPAYERYIAMEQLKSIDKTNRENKAQEKSIKFSKLISILSIALISILSLLSLSLYKNNIIRTKTNQLLKDKNQELEIEKEKAERASKARAEFLSTVSHELRTPLNAINGITHILIEDNPKPTQMNYLNSLKFSGNYLLTFINDILEINRVESDAVEVENIDFDLRDLLENIVGSFSEIANKNKTVYHLEIDEKIPSTLIGDPTKLSQIFINLINNAIKFTTNGNVWVSATIKKEKTNSVKIHFEVRDTGIGIPKDRLNTIFDSFTQGSVEINRKYGGTGLGLAIVKRLVALLGGKIKLESEEGKGSRFHFDVSFNISNNVIEKRTEPVYDESLLVGKKILLVEDNKINQMITQKMLERKKMHCHIIENGEDAVEHMRDNIYDLVLMDVHLPGINGTIATEHIRKFNQETPIIALTAISLDENKEMLLSYGMTDVITKPFDPDKFYEVIAVTICQRINTE
ncbi:MULTISPECIES: tetratricopeptide repeat-containing hybrid sensor histidine kinase/response regulator [Flavobacterium]|uniref:tetratricopeptide repeat-containing hybrid sensor histidine kinase/response regulator n=1 Tax=Flavobacterium TaxID=237 RepID=UPI001FCAA7C9|nr:MULTISPECIES: ATP-binding protein [Flavobacterium]UOK43851.1 ATP-binding protein [Flavobacterium enshiense]